MQPFQFAGSTVLITGASSGIGREFAEQLAAQKAQLVLTARSEEVLQQHAQTLRQQHGIRVEVIVADLARPNAAQALADAVEQRGLTVDVLVNNAGFGKFGAFTDEPLASYQQMLALNLDALMALSWRLLPGMRARSRGGVINLSSLAAFQPLPYVAVYAASKAFVLSFSQALAAEYRGTGVTVLALCPGNTTTNFAAVANAQMERAPAATPQAVVEAGIKAFLHGDAVHIHGASNFLVAQASRFLPRSWVTALAGRVSRRLLKNG